MQFEKNYIPLNIPFLNGKEKEYTEKCFRENWLSSAGPYVEEFERNFAEYLGVKYAVACSSGTAALHLALRTLNINSSDLVIAPNLTFIATVNAIKYINADPILIDADINTWQIDIKILKIFLKNKCFIKEKKCYHKNTGRRIAGIVTTHILGYASDIKKIQQIAKKYHLAIVEDAAEALGSKLDNKYLGTFGNLGCFSFNGNKLITTGSGGMLVTNKKKYAILAKHLSQQAKKSENNYIHTSTGYNYRMSNIQAAIGIAQLIDIEYRLKQKRKIHYLYKKQFANIKTVFFPEEVKSSQSSYWLNTVRVLSKRPDLKSRNIQRKLEIKKIASRLLWEPMKSSIPYKKSIYSGKKNSIQLYQTCISLPSSVNLNLAQQDRVIKEFINIIN